jgi:hypothetical protein
MKILSSSFEQGINGWRPVNSAEAVTMERLADGTAYSGSAFLRVTTSVFQGSIAQDVVSARNVSISVSGSTTLGGHAHEVVGSGSGIIEESSFGVFAWVRAAPGGPNVSANLTLWQFPPGVSTNIAFTVGSNWTLISNCIDIIAPQTAMIRIEFYLDSVNVALDIDSVLGF